jgi:hypothetical protein
VLCVTPAVLVHANPAADATRQTVIAIAGEERIVAELQVVPHEEGVTSR